MPPKPKFTKEEVARVAYRMIREEGLAALTARELGKRLGTSSSPIFTFYKNMDEVKLAARALALEEFKETISDYRSYTPAFKRIGMMLVSCGQNQPELFKLLFMQEHPETVGFESTVKDLGDVAETCISLIQSDYSMTPQEARILFEVMWTQAFGLGAMCAMKVVSLTEEEIGRRLGMAFVSFSGFLKSGKLGDIHGDLERNSETYHGKSLSDLPRQ